MKTGTELKDAALTLIESRRLTYIRMLQHRFVNRLILRRCGTIEDVIDGDRPDGVNPVSRGAMPKALIHAGIIVHDGWVNATRPEAHARPIKRWAIAVDEATARAWMAANPIPETPADDGTLPFMEAV